METNLRLVVNSEFKSGVLQDVVRARRLTSNLGFRSDIIPYSRYSQELGEEGKANCAVFDGAKSFLNLSGMVQSPRRIIILDRTERSYDDAVSQINELYLSSKGSSSLDISYLKKLIVPRSVSLMVMEG
jgi:hypothetical protein